MKSIPVSRRVRGLRFEWRGVLAGAYANDAAMSKAVEHLVDIDNGSVLCRKIKPERMSDIGSWPSTPKCPECVRRALKWEATIVRDK